MSAAARRSVLVFMMALTLVVGIVGHAAAPAQAAGWTIDPDGAP